MCAYLIYTLCECSRNGLFTIFRHHNNFALPCTAHGVSSVSQFQKMQRCHRQVERAEIRMKDKKARTIKDAAARQHLPYNENISHKQVWPRSFANTSTNQKPFFPIVHPSLDFYSISGIHRKHHGSTSTQSNVNSYGIYCGSFKFVQILVAESWTHQVHRILVK